MDAEMVAAAIERSYSQITTQLQGYSTHSGIGWKFMDKFVQLPFSIPPSEKGDMRRFVNLLFFGGKDTVQAKTTETQKSSPTVEEDSISEGENLRNIYSQEVSKNIQDLNKMIQDHLLCS